MSTAGSTEGSSDDTIQLRVSDSQYRDVGKGLARISHSLMAQLDLTAGDIIEINGLIFFTSPHLISLHPYNIVGFSIRYLGKTLISF